MDVKTQRGAARPSTFPLFRSAARRTRRAAEEGSNDRWAQRFGTGALKMRVILSGAPVWEMAGAQSKNPVELAATSEVVVAEKGGRHTGEPPANSTGSLDCIPHHPLSNAELRSG